MKVAIIGVGLIGGSVALDIRAKGFAQQIVGVDQNPQNAKEALQLGLVDKMVELDEASSADLILLATPVSTLPGLALEVL